MLRPGTSGSTFTCAGSKASRSRLLLKVKYHWSYGEQVFCQPQRCSVTRRGPYVLNENLCAEVVVRGPSAEGVPAPKTTETGEFGGNAFTARRATQRPCTADATRRFTFS